MRFDLVAFLGGLTVGAAAAALYSTTRSTKLGKSIASDGGPSGGFDKKTIGYKYPVQVVAWAPPAGWL